MQRKEYLSDSERQRRHEESLRLEALAAVRIERLRMEQAPLVSELASIGFPFKSLSEMLNDPGPYKAAIPILLEHLERPYSNPTRETIARCLAVPDASYAWDKLVVFYQNEPNFVDGNRNGAKGGLAAAVAAAALEQDIPKLTELARDPSLGSSRLLLLRRLRRSKSAPAKQALLELASDPDLEKEIASWRPRRSSTS